MIRLKRDAPTCDPRELGPEWYEDAPEQYENDHFDGEIPEEEPAYESYPNVDLPDDSGSIDNHADENPANEQIEDQSEEEHATTSEKESCPVEGGLWAGDYGLLKHCFRCKTDNECRLAHRRNAANLKKEVYGGRIFFLQIPLGFLLEPDLSHLDEKILAAVIYSFSRAWGHSKLRNSDIARICGVRKEAITRALRGYRNKEGLFKREWLAWDEVSLNRMPKSLHQVPQPSDGSEKRPLSQRTRRRLYPTLKTMRVFYRYSEQPKPEQLYGFLDRFLRDV